MLWRPVVRDHGRVLLLILIMTTVATAIGFTAIGILYQTAFEEERLRLVETAQSQARLMEAIARFDQRYSRDYPQGPEAATVAQLKDAHAHYGGFGTTGEFTLARREGDQIAFILRHRHLDLDQPQSIPFHSHLAEPMRQALYGRSGTVIGLDYRGVTVLAAHEPVAIMDLGIVAKIDLAEIRAPFLWAGGLVLGVALVLIAAGTGLFFKISNPMLRRLRDSEATFRSITAAAQDAIIMMDQDGRIAYCNPVTHRIFGHQEQQLVGKDLHRLLAPESYHEAFLKGFATFQDTGTGPVLDRILELTAVHKEGREFPIELSVSSLPLGNRWGAVGVIRDITERNEREAQLRQAQKMEAVGQLTGGIAHDFNNLLTIILGNLRLLKETLDGDPEAKELVDDALSATHDSAELTQRLLTFSRKQILRPETVDVNALLINFGNFLKRSLRGDVELGITTSREVSAVLADPSQLQHALLNLAINARDAMPRGGKLILETTRDHIGPSEDTDCPDLAPGDYVMIKVSDTGIGMTPEDTARATEPFFTTKPHGQGSGLGLSMVYGFARQSGGDARIHSELGKGTTVSLLLPETATRLPQGDGKHPVRDVQHGSETLLVVEDQSQVRKFATQSLNDLGYRVLQAEHAEAAIKTLDAEPSVDLLFCDIVMPGAINGRELARWAVAHHPGVKILLTTGFSKGSGGDPPAVKDDFLLLKKPYTREHLGEAVRLALDAQ